MPSALTYSGVTRRSDTAVGRWLVRRFAPVSGSCQAGKFVRTAFGLILAAIFVWPATSAEPTTVAPDLSGTWAREYLFFGSPDSGHGPIRSKEPRQGVGDDSDPILKPEAAAILKQRGEVTLSGRNFPQPSSECAPMSVPYILQGQEIQFLQKADEVVILYMEDHHVRHVTLNSQHPATITPSWSGDSVGHYEGDTLVIDTVGFKTGPLSMADRFGTPKSEVAHVVERYHLISYETALNEFKRAGLVRLPVTLAIGTGVAIDPDYRGKGLRIDFTVDDPKVANTSWSGTTTFLRANSWVEEVCAENLHKYYEPDTPAPSTGTPDF